MQVDDVCLFEQLCFQLPLNLAGSGAAAGAGATPSGVELVYAITPAVVQQPGALALAGAL